MRAGKQKRHAEGRGASNAVSGLRALYGKGWQSPTLPRNWRDRLPDPATYYGRHVAKLGRPNGGGWAQGICPFHEDGDASLSVHVTEGGGWKCFAGCGGGDLVSFHMRWRGCDFKAAVAELVRGGA